MKENSLYDKKSIRTVLGKTADFAELAKDCVAFSNAQGGIIDIGIENNATLPPSGQQIPEELPTQLVNKIKGITHAVIATPEVITAENGGEYIRLSIQRNPNAIAITSSGKIYIRIGDNSVPVGSEDVARLAADKGCLSWEDTITNYSWIDADPQKLATFLTLIKGSDRVSQFVKQKSRPPRELHLSGGRLSFVRFFSVFSGAGESRLSVARQDAAALDAERLDFQGKGLGVHQQGGFCAGIESLVGNGNESGDRRDGHDPALFLAAEYGKTGVDDFDRTVETGLELVADFINGCIFGCSGHAVPGIADHGIQTSLLFQYLFDSLSNGLLVIDIHDDGFDPLVLRRAAAAGGSIDSHSGISHQAGRCSADAAASAGQKNNLGRFHGWESL